jgi:hypothetical protein
MEPRQDEMDRLLRRSMATSVPSLPSDFDQRLMRQILPGSRKINRHRQIMLGGYGLVSIAVSVVLMHGQGLGWGVIAGLILAPLALIAAVRLADQAHR